MGHFTAVFMLARQIQKCSQEILFKARMGEDLQDQLDWLAQLEFKPFVASFRRDEERLAFWINLYNGLTVHHLRNKPETLSKSTSRRLHFNEKKICIAGKDLSFNMIEHGILRRSKVWWSLGYLGDPFSSRTVKALQVDRLDPRLHFALNCGGLSCPPIRHYDPEGIHEQLDLAASAFIEGGSEVSVEGDVVHISRLFQWYQGDFGGPEGIRSWIASYMPVPSGKWKIRYQAYDWTLGLPEVPPREDTGSQGMSSNA